MSSLPSAEWIDSFAADAFRAIVTQVAPTIEDASEVSTVTARSARRLTAGVKHRELAGNVIVDFTVIMTTPDALARGFTEVSEMRVAASDDEWVRTPEALAAAMAVAMDLESTIKSASYDGEWNAAAAEVVSGMPLAKTKGGALSLSMVPGGIVLDVSSVGAVVCSPDKYASNTVMRLKCITTPSPTIVLPSQVPTPAPTRKPDYIGVGPSLGFISFILLGFINVAIFGVLVARHTQRSAAKSLARSDWFQKQQLGKFANAHVIDLFGANAIKKSKKDLKKSRFDRGDDEANHFSAGCAALMFKELDENRDGKLTASDLAAWLRRQEETIGSKGLVKGLLETDEVDAFLRCGQPAPEPEDSSESEEEKTEDAPAGDVGDVIPASGLAALFGSVAPSSVSVDQHEPSAALDGSGGKRPKRIKAPLPQPFLTLSRFQRLLKQFPQLAFDWETPLSAQYHHSTGQLSREDVVALFKRIDTDGDGWVTARDLRVWRRMLRVGRPEDEFVKSFMVGARLRPSKALDDAKKNREGAKKQHAMVTSAGGRGGQ